MLHQSVQLRAHESVGPSEEWDHRMLHCNRLISSLPHSVPFHPDSFSVSLFWLCKQIPLEEKVVSDSFQKTPRRTDMNLFLCMSCVRKLCIFIWCLSIRRARWTVNCGFMCPFSDRCLEGDRGLWRHQTTSVCCLCRCSSTTGFDYLLLLECEIWICFSITQSLACVGAGRSVAECWESSTEFVLVIVSPRGLRRI